MLAFISIVLSLIAILISFIFYKLTFWSRKGIPNDLSSRSELPFHQSDLRSHQKYGKIVGFYEGLNPSLSITDPGLIKKILVTDFPYVADHRDLTSPNEPLHKALFFLPYAQWKRTRTIIAPSFTAGKLKSLKPSISSSVDSLFRYLEPKAKNKEIIDLRQYFDRLTFDVIAKLAFGINVDTINNPDNSVFESSKLFFTSNQTFKKFLVFAFPFLNKYFDFLYFDEKSQKTIANTVKSVIKERIAKNIEVPDLLQLWIESSEHSKKSTKNSFEKLTEEEVVAQSLNILGAGFETTSTQLCFICQFLALNPEYDQLLLNEINSTFEKECEIGYDELMKMPYLDAFVKEIMRLYCSVNRIDRKTTTDYKVDNIFIPKDTSIVIPIWALHMDPDNFEEPELFKPERFLKENEKGLKEYTYMPFGAGPRNCVGMRLAQLEMKYILVRLIIKFRFEACDQTNKLEFFKLNQVANMKNLYLRLLERD